MLVVGLVLVACAFPRPVVQVPLATGSGVAVAPRPTGMVGGGRHLVVFFDGSDSGPVDRSNVYKLHEMVVAEGRADVLTFYIEGVGVGFKPVGSATGWGIDHRLKKAYAFLLEHHRAGDRVHLFGFSRGAFAARILAAMLYYAGLPSRPFVGACSPSLEYLEERNSRATGKDCTSRVSELVYQAYKGKWSPKERIERIGRTLDRFGLRFSRPVRVATLGLWDTVEALGLVDTWEAIRMKLGFAVPQDPGERNRRYGDQLCNVDRAIHALSIDDNRADEYTPKLLTLPHLFRNCEAGDPAREAEDFRRVEEVWFAGSHADVGGSYLDCEYTRDCISNVSLNWVVHLLVHERTGVLHEDAALEANGLAEAHDGENGSLLYERVQRDPRQLIRGSPYNGARPKVHCSVIERLARRAPRCHEYGWGFPRGECAKAGATDVGPGDSQGPDRDACFFRRGTGYEYVGSENPGRACSDDGLEPVVPGCWFTVVR